GAGNNGSGSEAKSKDSSSEKAKESTSSKDTTRKGAKPSTSGGSKSGTSSRQLAPPHPPPHPPPPWRARAPAPAHGTRHVPPVTARGGPVARRHRGRDHDRGARRHRPRRPPPARALARCGPARCRRRPGPARRNDDQARRHHDPLRAPIPAPARGALAGPRRTARGG